ncbi:hypothetical protein CK203_026629 [Vitis vinifera]|uniref:Uncharacterized protein n=1 Tax=Vitis vinifera TaxID=29760 RepID=A0A438IU37_VITVI|nr:hypothetical protein CK203_026629 [Vitis vinifera]
MVGGGAVAKAGSAGCGVVQVGRSGVMRMHAPGREWKRWRVWGSRSSASQWMTGRLAQEVGSDAMGFQAQRVKPQRGLCWAVTSQELGWAAACPPVITGHSKGGNLELEFVRLREEEIGRRQQLDLHHSMADRVLEEEAREGVLRLFWGAKGGHSGRKWVTKIKCRRARRERGWLLGLGRGLEKEILSFLGKIRKRGRRYTVKVREIPRLEGLECYGVGRGVLIAGTKDRWRFWIGKRANFPSPAIQKCGRWRDLGVYGGLWPFLREERECLWEEIGAIRGLWEEPWCLGGLQYDPVPF